MLTQTLQVAGHRFVVSQLQHTGDQAFVVVQRPELEPFGLRGQCRQQRLIHLIEGCLRQCHGEGLTGGETLLHNTPGAISLIR